jgi:hypothetical protein
MVHFDALKLSAGSAASAAFLVRGLGARRDFFELFFLAR